jgi:hypothetical protein
VRPIFAVLTMIACLEPSSLGQNNGRSQSVQLDNAIVLAVQLEAYANHLESRRDVCVGFGDGLEVNQREIMSKLLHAGLKLQPNEWCNRGPRGLKISIIAPIVETAPGKYVLVLELGDLRPIRQSGEHFGTLLRRGEYSVTVREGSEVDLESYRKTCCSDPSTGKS